MKFRKNDFGERLLKLMQKQGLSQRELARKADIDEVTISRYVHCLREPSYSTIIKIAKGLCVKPAELFEDEEDSKFTSMTDVLESELKDNEKVSILRKMLGLTEDSKKKYLDYGLIKELDNGAGIYLESYNSKSDAIIVRNANNDIVLIFVEDNCNKNK